MSGYLIKMFFKSHYGFAIVTFYVGFKCSAEDIQGHLIDVSSDVQGGFILPSKADVVPEDLDKIGGLVVINFSCSVYECGGEQWIGE